MLVREKIDWADNRHLQNNLIFVANHKTVIRFARESSIIIFIGI